MGILSKRRFGFGAADRADPGAHGAGLTFRNLARDGIVLSRVRDFSLSIDPANSQFSWKLFSYKWEGATPGEHTLVSRATDANGVVQVTAADLKRKKTFLEDNAQFPRKVMIG